MLTPVASLEQAELLFTGHKQLFPSPQPTLLFQFPSIKATDFFPSLLGECGDPIFTPSNTGGDHVDNRT